MTKVNYPNGVSRTSEHKYSPFGASTSNSYRQAEDLQKEVAEEIAPMRRNELAVNGSKDFDDVELPDHRLTEPDDSQPLIVEPPLTLSKIFSKLTALERLWLARMVKSHGKDLVLARWPAYEVQINYVRYLR